MSKGAMATSAFVIVVTGGYFAYDYYDSHKAKAKAQSVAKGPRKGSADGSQGGSDQGSEAAGQRGSRQGSAPGSQAGSEAGSGDEPAAPRAAEVGMPDLTGKTPEEATKLLTGLGFKDDALALPPDMTCYYEDERKPVPVGTICNQERSVGTKVMTDTKVRAVVEYDTWEHGGVKAGNEWRRMPDLSGMTLARAKAVLREKGFADDEFAIVAPRAICDPGIVCTQYPKADTRKYVSRVGELGVGE